ncbi:hypothetical protein TNCV_3419661 [Trichonephila clavipes]|nr:hypothetical protein TNCV_3419661 [Trichonephila clavipes]
MITNVFIPELNNHDVQELWFQQDGATCHTARATIDLLKDTFGDRLISRFGPVNWPPRSCGLRWRHRLSPPPQFWHGTEGEGNILQSPCTRDSTHKTFGPTDLTSTYSVCTRWVFGGIGHRTQVFRSGVRCSIHKAGSVMGTDDMFMNDNAPIHGARVVNQYLERKTLLQTEFPACSPDLNPIEHVLE